VKETPRQIERNGKLKQADKSSRGIMSRPARKSASPRIDYDYSRAFSRNIGLVSESEQLFLREKHIAIPGCGGVGALYAKIFARMGVGRFSIADFDRYEVENINRQFGAKLSTFDRHKAEVVAEEIREINPEASVNIFADGVTSENCDDFLKGVNLVIDGLDFFAFGARELLFRKARERGLPVITAGPLGFSTAMLIFSPTGMSFDEYFDVKPQDDRMTKALKFAIGLAPLGLNRKYMDPTKIDFAAGRAPSHVVGVTLCGGFAAAEALKLLLNRGPVRFAPHFVQIDAYRGLMKRGYLWRGNRNPWQRLQMYFVKKFLAKRIPK